MRSFGVILSFLSGIVLFSCHQQEQAFPQSINHTPSASIASRQSQAWNITESMHIGRSRHTATLLPDGTVLVTGGIIGSFTSIGTTTSVEIYDPNTGTWSFGEDMPSPRSRHTATLLQDGSVLVVGGRNQNGSTAAVELYDINTGTWSQVASMHMPRDYHSATLLQDGRVLVAGGLSGGDGFDNPVEKSVEIYDPATGTWSMADHMAISRWGHTATLLNDGTVLVAGGTSPAGDGVYTVRTEIYNPETDLWKNADGMTTPRGFHAAVLLPDGNVLVAGGLTLPSNAPRRTRTAEIFLVDFKKWVSTGDLNIERGVIQTSATLLQNGHVLVAGGPGPTCELYDPASGVWTMTGSMFTGRNNHTVTLLDTGNVLTTGGENRNGFISTAEIYSTWD